MDYIDQLKQLSARIEKLVPNISTEEATKTALVLPFFQLLGYDVFNPLEFVPEYTADVGIKKGEKVDYAIVMDGKPAILIEAKWCGENLDEHNSQLFRYFGTTEAKIGILTNGVVYRFYTDLDEPNKMDLAPFMEFNMMDIRENLVNELKRFHHDSLDLDKVFSAASELKYTTAIKTLLSDLAASPTDDFVNFIVGYVYSGRRTAAILEKFKPLVKRSFSQYLNDVLNDRFKTMLADTAAEEKAASENTSDSSDGGADHSEPVVQTTPDELNAYIIIKTLLCEEIDPSRISYKDTQSYFSIIVDGKVSKWICRLQIESKKKSITFRNEDERGYRKQIQYVDELLTMRQELVDSLKLLME